MAVEVHLKDGQVLTFGEAETVEKSGASYQVGTDREVHGVIAEDSFAYALFDGKGEVDDPLPRPPRSRMGERAPPR